MLFRNWRSSTSQYDILSGRDETPLRIEINFETGFSKVSANQKAFVCRRCESAAQSLGIGLPEFVSDETLR